MRNILNIPALPAWVGHLITWVEAMAFVTGLFLITIVSVVLTIKILLKIWEYIFCYYVIIKEKVKKVKNKK